MNNLEWKKLARLQEEELRLRLEIFDITCSIQILEAERRQASEQDIATLKHKITAQKRELNASIAHQLAALNELPGNKNDCQHSC